MTAAHRVACVAATLIVLLTFAPAPAEAQFAPLGGAGGDMMTQMAPMLEMMKAKMGKRRFAMLMQTMGPMMARMMAGGGGLGGIPGGLGGMPFGAADTMAVAPEGYGMGSGGGDIAGMLGGAGGAEMIGMIPQLMQLANLGGGHAGKQHRRRQ